MKSLTTKRKLFIANVFLNYIKHFDQMLKVFRYHRPALK